MLPVSPVFTQYEQRVCGAKQPKLLSTVLIVYKRQRLDRSFFAAKQHYFFTCHMQWGQICMNFNLLEHVNKVKPWEERRVITPMSPMLVQQNANVVAPTAPLCIDSVWLKEPSFQKDGGKLPPCTHSPNAGRFWQLIVSVLRQPFGSSSQRFFSLWHRQLEGEIVKVWIKVWDVYRPNPLSN